MNSTRASSRKLPPAAFRMLLKKLLIFTCPSQLVTEEAHFPGLHEVGPAASLPRPGHPKTCRPEPIKRSSAC